MVSGIASSETRIVRVFTWRDGRPDDRDEIRSLDIPQHVTHAGTLFELRTWDIRYPQGKERVTDASTTRYPTDCPSQVTCRSRSPWPPSMKGGWVARTPRRVRERDCRQSLASYP